MTRPPAKARVVEHPIRLEVCVLWGGSIVHLRSFRRPRPVSLGEAPDADLRIPATLIGEKNLRLVDFDSAGRPFVQVPSAACGHVASPEGTELSTAYRDGPATRTRCAQQRIPLSIGNVVTLVFENVVVVVTAFEENPRLRRTATSKQAWGGYALSFTLHAAVLLTMLTVGWGHESLSPATIPDPPRLVRIVDDWPPNDPGYRPWYSSPPGSEYGSRPAPVEVGSMALARLSEPIDAGSIPVGRPIPVVRPSTDQRAIPTRGIAPAANPRDNPSRFVVLPEGTTPDRVRDQIATDRGNPPRVEDLLYAFTQRPVAAAGALPLLTRVDAVPSPFDREHHFARVVLQVPNNVAKPRRRVLAVESSVLAGARGRGVVGALTDRLAAGSEIAVVSFGDRARVELGRTKDRSAGVIRSVMHRASQRPHGGGLIALLDGLRLAMGLACSSTQLPTDLVVVFEHAALISSPGIASLSSELETPGCARTTLHAIQILRTNSVARLLDSFPAARVGRQLHTGQESDTLQLERLGDPLAPPAAVDIIVEVLFDPDRVRSYRLIGYEGALNPEPLGSATPGSALTSTLRAGEQITVLYDLRLVSGRTPGLEVRVDYRSPTEPDVRHITHRLTRDKSYPSPRTAPRDLVHAIAVVEFAEYLRESPYVAASSLDKILRLASRSNVRESAFARLVRAEMRSRHDDRVHP